MYQHWPENPPWVDACLLEDMQNVRLSITHDMRFHREGILNALAEKMKDDFSTHIGPVMMLVFSRIADGNIKLGCYLAKLIEYVYVGSLLHDDVTSFEKNSSRNLSEIYIGENAEAILLGDFVYSKAFQLMVKTNDLMICRYLSDALNRLSQGRAKRMILLETRQYRWDDILSVADNSLGALLYAVSGFAGILTSDTKIQEGFVTFTEAYSRLVYLKFLAQRLKNNDQKVSHNEVFLWDCYIEQFGVELATRKMQKALEYEKGRIKQSLALFGSNRYVPVLKALLPIIVESPDHEFRVSKSLLPLTQHVNGIRGAVFP